jgi:hypothetical protein
MIGESLLQFVADFDYWKLTTLVLASFGAYLALPQYRLVGRNSSSICSRNVSRSSPGRGCFRVVSWRPGVCDLKPLWEYRAAIGEATFLFDDDITEYLEQIYQRAVGLHTNAEIMSPLPVGEERSKLTAKISEDLGWLLDQLPELKVRFAPCGPLRVPSKTASSTGAWF